MIEFRCTQYANTDLQCWRIASRKVKGRWVCLEHLDSPLTPIPEPSIQYESLGSTSPDPEIRKKYFRLYRRVYRIHNKRASTGFKWPTSIEIEYYYKNITIWRIGGKSETFEKGKFHCEQCCNQIEVTRIKYNPPTSYSRWRVAYQKGRVWYRGAHYRINAAHECAAYPNSPVKIIHCDRCGKLGTKGHKIKHNRPMSGDYGDKLCIDCYRIMRPFWGKVNEQRELVDALMELKHLMRKSGIHPTAKALNRNWWYSAFDYHKTWWRETHKDST